MSAGAQPSPFSLSRHTILVTGASSGIGAGTSRHLAALGARIIATGRHSARLHETLGSLPGETHEAHVADLTDNTQLRHLAEVTPPLNGILHCAGIASVLPFKFLSGQKIAETMGVNFDSSLLLIQALLKKKKIADGASIVFLGSISTRKITPGYGLYSASKAALTTAAKVLALELAPRRIRVNTLAAGMIQTPMTAGDHQVSDESWQKHALEYPLGIGRVEDAAHAIAFLLSPASQWMTGSEITLDGGISLK